LTAADVYRALWRHKFVIVALTAVCVAATWYVTSREAKVYKASTLVRVQIRSVPAGSAFNDLETARRLAQSYSEIVDSGALTNRIRKASGSQKTGAAGTSLAISAQPVEDTELIWISARSRVPRDAAVAANAAPAVLRAFVRQSGRSRDQIVTVKAATVPSSPISPRIKLNVGLALLLGLIFNGALALLFELIRDRMPETSELAASIGYPVLATIPILLRRRSSTSPEPSLPARQRAPAPSDRGSR
jgi:capsular polysaccharide biosynthesis protein